MQGRVFLAEPRKTARDLLLVPVRLGRDGQAVGRTRNLDRWQRATVLHAEGVAGERMHELGRGRDVAGVDLGRRNVLLATREEDLRQPLLAAAGEVGQMGVCLQAA